MVAKNPYLVTALIFAIILFGGRWFWRWGDMESAFLLLFFFLVTIGIRLDEIVKKIAATNDRLDRILQKNFHCASSSQPASHPELRQGAAGEKADSVKEDD